jgi:DNA-binding transcriptional LysR family regulator
VSQIETQIAMAAAGLGTAIVPSLALPACRRYSVDIDLLVEPTASMDFCHISKSDRRPTAMMNEYYETLVSVLSATFGELPG